MPRTRTPPVFYCHKLVSTHVSTVTEAALHAQRHAPVACLQALSRAGFVAWAAPVEVQGDTANAVLCAMQQAAVNVGAGDDDGQAAALELVEWLLAQGGLPDTHVHTGAFQHLCFGEREGVLSWLGYSHDVDHPSLCMHGVGN